MPPSPRPQPVLAQRLGILGGGQLGKMLLPECMKLDIRTAVLDPDPDCPCAPWCAGFVPGDFRDAETVHRFGQQVDVLTIEIEQVNVDALERLVAEGKTVHPAPAALRTIQDKGLQKRFYAEHGIPTSDFRLYDGAEALRAAVATGERPLPFVQKSRELGYDGKGVHVVRRPEDLDHLLEGPCLAEELVAVDKELSVIVAQDAHGTVRAFPPVEMVFHPTANLVEFLRCPADLSPALTAEAEALAIRALRAFDIRGVLAVEMFLDRNGQLWVNEVAPRPHNSGHHTIESTHVSQYEQHLRSILGLPLGSTALKQPAVMLNLLGEPGYSGPVHYAGLSETLAAPGTSLHLYGKRETRPFRKMGHLTVCAETIAEAVERAKGVEGRLRCGGVMNYEL
jgi:5-(carboxyamino)imidazole ribonucleotide synthase